MKIKIDKELENNRVVSVLTEMLRRVDPECEEFDFTEPLWYRKYEWTVEEENDFKGWLIQQLKKDKELRHDLLDVNSTKAIVIRNAVNWFVFNYGWRIKE
jgi:hypothetical protein